MAEPANQKSNADVVSILRAILRQLERHTTLLEKREIAPRPIEGVPGAALGAALGEPAFPSPMDALPRGMQRGNARRMRMGGFQPGDRLEPVDNGPINLDKDWKNMGASAPPAPVESDAAVAVLNQIKSLMERQTALLDAIKGKEGSYV